MKVIHLTGKDFYGAGRAAYRLHKGLQHAGVESEMWVGNKRHDDDTVRKVHSGRLKKLKLWCYRNLEKLSVRIKGHWPKEMFSTGGYSFTLANKINRAKPDLVHVHWINRGFMSLNDLAKIEAPLVISMHDMWYFTGGCHYDEECSLYKKSCGNCPVLASSELHDLSHTLLASKQKVYNKKQDMFFVGLSVWMANCAKESFVLKGRKVLNLPNGIDLDLFKPVDRQGVKERLGINEQKNLIIYAAVDALSESRKGYVYLQEALKCLDGERYEVLVIGESHESNEVAGIKTHFLGEINDDSILVEILSAADVSVVPSLQENLSNMIMESLACATPVVAFNIGGNGDMVEHKVNGYLAKKQNVDDLARGIEWCCDKEHNAKLANNAKATVEQKFDINIVTKDYLNFYASVLNNEVDD
ncbi:glycosyltransferase family 4 protein [Carboxylicivirga sp. N1Y90]|uniref:glycosyltransferase family 4 protein n=1 Tax=Carboxylicivirga fragile TaxID=3417571 RepID=UPI003D33D56A|nr:glycosyltransferase family 4 protein [Marinilabiliaceae bacterium N1Y90]